MTSKLVNPSRAHQTEVMAIPFDPEERPETKSEVAQKWKEEIDRRIREFESGEEKGVPLEDSLARARKMAGL